MVSQFFAVVVPGGAVSFGTPASLAVATGGTAYSQTITAVGGATPYSFSLVGGSLPSGLSLSSAGVLSGVPAVNGTFNITVRVTDSASQTAERSYALTVNAPPIALTPTSLGGGTAGSPYAQTLSASGGTAPYSYAVTGGALPAGVVLSPTGVLAGTPSVAGTFGLTVTATDALGFQGTQAYTLVTGAPTIALTPTSLAGGTAGSPYAQTLSASGGTAPYSYAVTAGALPAGINLAAATGALAGTPTAAGTFNLTVTATDQLGFQATQAYSLAIGQPAPVAVADSASVNANGTATFGVTGNDSGPITSIAITRQPAHGTAKVDRATGDDGFGACYVVVQVAAAPVAIEGLHERPPVALRATIVRDEHDVAALDERLDPWNPGLVGLADRPAVDVDDQWVPAGLDLVGLKEHPVDRQPVSRLPGDDLRQDEVATDDTTGRREGQLAALAVEGDLPEIRRGNR